MDSERLVEFIALAEDLSYRKAAGRLLMSQSSLSRHIDDLEREVGFSLFARDRHHVALTKEGRRFLTEVGDYPDRLRRAVNAAKNVTAEGESQPIRLGYGQTRGVELVERTMVGLAQQEIPVEVDLIQGDTAELTRALDEGEVDLALLRPPVAGFLDDVLLYDELLVAVLPPGHPLAASATVSLESLFAEPFVAVRRESDPMTIRIVDERLAEMGVRPLDVVRRVQSVMSMLLMVEAGNGVGLARAAVVRLTHLDGLVFRPIGPRDPGVPVHLAWRREETDPRRQRVQDAILAACASLPPGYRVPDDVGGLPGSPVAAHPA